MGALRAALFAERRETEERLARSNMLLERERESKLINVQAIIAAIAHEIRQPLGAIMASASAARRWLERTPPDQDKARAALDRITNEGLRASEVFDSIRALFGKVNQQRQTVDMNDIILDVIDSLSRVTPFCSRSEAENPHIVLVLAIIDEFRERIAFWGIQEKFRKRLA